MIRNSGGLSSNTRMNLGISCMEVTLGSLVTVSILTRTFPLKLSLFSCQVKFVQLSDDSAGHCTSELCFWHAQQHNVIIYV